MKQIGKCAGTRALGSLVLMAVLYATGCTSYVEPPPEDMRVDILLQKLAQELNPDYPGLEPFFLAWKEGQKQEAKEELLSYFRQRQVPVEALPPEIDRGHPTLAAAVDGLRGIFILQGAKGSTMRPDGTIDWSARGPSNDREWGWMLNRHPFFRHFLVAYEERGDPAFIQAIDRILLEWYWQHPPPDGFRLSSAWRALEAARRMVDSWLPVYDSLRNHPELSDEAILAIIASAAEHARYLQANHHYGGNHLITEMMALATIAVVWPEFLHSRKWLEYASQKAAGEILSQTYPDGAHKELANHYQWIASSSFQRLYQLLLISEYQNQDVLQVLRTRLETMWDYYAGVVRPNGYGPLNNDSDLEPNARQLLPIADFYQREDWLYMATQGREGTKPDGHPSRYYPWASHVVMRTGWGEEADWLFFDRGFFGTDHQQDDRLHLSVALGGRDLLVDSGRYVYRDDRWSRFFRSAFAHNIPTLQKHRRVLPDREAQEPVHGVVDWGETLQLTSGLVPMESVRGGGWSASHTRAIVMGKGWVWIVDQLDAREPDLATYRWRFHPDVDWEDSESETTFSLVNSEGEVLAYWVEAVRRVSGSRWLRGQTKPYLQGWYSPSYNLRLKNWAREVDIPVHGREVSSWLLMDPQNFKGANNLHLENEGGTSRLSLSLPDGESIRLQLSFEKMPDHPPYLQTEDAYLYR